MTNTEMTKQQHRYQVFLFVAESGPLLHPLLRVHEHLCTITAAQDSLSNSSRLLQDFFSVVSCRHSACCRPLFNNIAGNSTGGCISALLSKTGKPMRVGSKVSTIVFWAVSVSATQLLSHTVRWFRPSPKRDSDNADRM